MAKSNGKQERAVIVTTAHRGVFFGYATDTDGETIALKKARLCVYWSRDMKGFMGLAASGPSKDCREWLQLCVRVDERGCWLWTRSLRNKDGYGAFRFRGGRRTGAHRAAYELFVGVVPPGTLVLHRCDVPACCNPDHLFIGTSSDNVQDCLSKGRHVALRGEDQPMSKLSRLAVEDLRSRKIVTGSISKWAREFGVSRRAIRFALDGATWT